MADSLQFRKGARSTVKPLPIGMPGFVTDEDRLIIGKGDGTNVEFPNRKYMENLSSQLADNVLLRENISIDVTDKKFGAVGNANYYNSADKKYYVDSAFTQLAHDDTQAFTDALNYAKDYGKVILPSGKHFWITGKLPFYNGLIIHGTNPNYDGIERYSQIKYTGTDYMFDVVSDTNVSYMRFEDFEFISKLGAGGFLGFHKDEYFQSALSLAHIIKLEVNRVFFNKDIKSDGSLEGIGISAINAKGLMNCTFNNCHFNGWDLALNIQQCDINEFYHCWFTGNVQIAKLKFLNSYGSQNSFNKCDFEVRRNYTENYYQFFDEERYTAFNDCYFQIGTCLYTPTSPTPTHSNYNKIKGWLYSDGGEKKLMGCRFDYNDGFTSEALFNIKLAGNVNFIACENSAGFYNSVSQKVLIESWDSSVGLDAKDTQYYGTVNLIACNKAFISHFDIENKQVEIVGRKYLDTINEGRTITDKLFYDKNTAFNSLEKVILITDNKATRKQVFQLYSTNNYSSNSYFNIMFKIGQNSIIRKKQNYDVRVRLRVDTVYSDPYPTIRIVKLDSNKNFVSTVLTKDVVNTSQSVEYVDYCISFDTTSFATNDIFQLLVYYRNSTTTDTTKKCYIEEVEFYNTTTKTYL